MVQDFPKCKKKVEDIKRIKIVNKNATHSNSNMNSDITQVAITAFYTSQPNDNIIPA